MKLDLRNYQAESVDQTWDWIIKTKESCVLELCTAAGKSFILAELAYRIHNASKKKVLILAPTAEIVNQNREKFLLTGLPASVFSASAGSKCLKHPVIFGSPLTVKNKIDVIKNNVAAVFIDECHLLGGSIKKIIDDIKKSNPSVRVIGVTGTPYRLSDGYIYQYDEKDNPVAEHQTKNPYFNKLVCSVKTRTLIDAGFLCKPVCGESIESYKTDALEKGATGLFTGESVSKVFTGKGRKTESIISQIIDLTKDRICCMIFASSVRHANEIMEYLEPYSPELITGETKKADRKRIINRARNMEVKFLVSVGALTTGVDIPCVDTIAILRATESVGLMQQIIGRGLRLHDYKKDCLVLDYAENIERHCPNGDIFDPTIRAIPESDGEFLLDVKCPACSTVNVFKGRPNPDNFEISEDGYFLDLIGEPVTADDDKPIPAHFGRRCFGRLGLDRCEYRWSFKECDECGHQNDIAARFCEECDNELVDPNEKLRLEFARIKADPYTLSTDKVIAWECKKHYSMAGNETLKVTYTTEYRTFDVWYMTRKKHLWNDLCVEVFGKPAPDVDTYLEYVNSHGKMPRTITVKRDKDSKFYTVIAHGRPEDVMPD